MPQVELTIEQVVDALERLTPIEKAEVLQRLRDATASSESRDAWLARLRGLRSRLGKSPRPFADDIIEDREDRF